VDIKESESARTMILAIIWDFRANQPVRRLGSGGVLGFMP